MSNLVETLLDKLIFPSLSVKESPLPTKFSGSQNLVENNVKMDPTLMSEFHQMLNSDCYAPHYQTMNYFSGVKNINPYFDTSNSLVSRVSKLFLPSLFPIQEFHLSTQAEYLLTPELYLTPRGSILGEIIDQIDLFVNRGYNVKTPEKAEEMPCGPEVPQAPPVVIIKQSSDVTSVSMALQKVAAKPKAPVDNAHNSQIMNQEFVNRKARKLNKQSKKRRRRQKKSEAKTTPVVAAKDLLPSDQESGKDASQGPISHSIGDGRDIFCDIISVTGQILPDVTSFVISVDDDTDWDVCSDSDWLNDCSEFEVTGLFIGNLTAPTIASCPVKKVSSRLEVPPVQEDKETLKLKNLLRSVNKAWAESTQDLKKPRLSSKVSFAPDEDLVRVYEVDNYERKGEWEIYALGRMRFKKKIDQLESVISPCLKEEHREKVFKNLQKSTL